MRRPPRPGRHPRAGRVYLWALGGVAATATVMATVRWREDAYLFVIGTLAFALGLYGYTARRRHRPGWPPHHATGMSGSYILLLTGFYVDNGPFLPLWDRLPHIAYWLLPSIVGVPLTRRALRRYRTGSESQGSDVRGDTVAVETGCSVYTGMRAIDDSADECRVTRTNLDGHFVTVTTTDDPVDTVPDDLAPAIHLGVILPVRKPDHGA